MNKQTEALKMAIAELEKGEGWMDNVNATLQACKEALKNIEVGDAEIKQMLDDIEYYKNRLAKYEEVL